MKNKKFLQTTFLLNLIFLVSCISPVYISAQKSASKILTPREIARKTLPSTVLLVMENSETKEAKSGSGFFVAEDVVVTNFHVIKETTEGYAKIYGEDKIYEVLGVVGIDEENDLALLKIKGIKGKPLKLNTDDATAIGDEVFAVGNPKGLEGTFSQGIVSSIRKTDKLNLLQITASISPGSSGGAVLNDRGEVVGVAVGGIESGQSLNFAIPISLLRSLVSSPKPLIALKGNTTVVENKTQPNAAKIIQPPNNLPSTKNVPQRASRMGFKKTDLLEENLFGNVKTIKEFKHLPEIKFEEWVLGKVVTVSTKKYNLDGYKEYSEEIVYSGDVFDLLALGYMYDVKELPLTLKKLYYYDYSDNVTTEERYLKCATCSTFKLEEKILLKYKGDEQTRFYSDGEIFWKRITHSENGKTIVEHFEGDGKLSNKKIAYKNKIGEVEEEWTPSKVDKDKLELSSKRITVEDKGQLKTISICIKDGKEFECGDYTIQDKNTKLNLYGNYKGYVQKYEYEFDLIGNWTKQTEYQRVTKFGKSYFEPSKVIIREISYY